MTLLPHIPAKYRVKYKGASSLKTASAAALLSLVMVGCGGGGASTAPSPPVANCQVSIDPPQVAMATTQLSPFSLYPSLSQRFAAETISVQGSRLPVALFPPSAQLAQQCLANNTGSEQTERSWIRSYVDEAYLWYNEVPNLDPLSYAGTKENFFQALTRQGVPARDRFSFSYPTDKWNQLINAGSSASYGIEWAFLSNTVPRVLRVAYVQPNSPAGIAKIERGAKVLAVNGVDINTTTQAGINTLNAGLFPSVTCNTVTLTIQENGAVTPRVVQLTSANVISSPVLDVRTGVFGGINFGYVLFNDHLASAETQLIAAVNQLKAANVQELVLDLRYNGGGYLYIAEQLGYMIATPAVTGRTFEKLRFNDKRAADNAAAPELFLNTTTGTPPQPLPQLGLSRIYVLTTDSTCSASESVMNSLRPFVNVIQIGSTTCGKPYGFTAKDNCGTSYFPIEFEGVNDAGQGGYSNGFTPGATFPGCPVGDDFDHALGDSAEKMLGAAISHRLTGACPAIALGRESITLPSKVLLRTAARENKFLLPR